MSPTPLLFVHAFPFDARMWAAQADALRGKRRVLAPDLRGFGSNVAGDLPTTLDQHARDLVDMLDRAGIPRAVVVGISMGGYIAMALMRRWPARVAGLLLADTTAEPDPPARRAERQALAQQLRREGMRVVVDAMLPKLVAPDASDAVRQQLRAWMLSQHPDGVAAGLRMLEQRPDARPSLAAIRAPTTLACGALDALTPPPAMREMAARIPGSSLHELSGVGHMSHLEAPEAFAQLLRNLLDRVDVG
ncbi:MAG: alpha/beta hydrolase [Polyangiaceae bacterium]|jgi:pimeloyl-ACP methyl ester carboxylesterase|nr:alpha/beta hydrolase [Polyangiaceae bacterium]